MKFITFKICPFYLDVFLCDLVPLKIFILMMIFIFVL